MSVDLKRRKASDEDSRELELEYLSGFGNHFESESLPGSLPRGQNNPKTCPYGLYAEQLSGTSFTTPISKNKKVWLYKIKPTVCHLPYEEVSDDRFNLFLSDFSDKNAKATPQQYRWKPMPFPSTQKTFVEGIVSCGGVGNPELKTGFAVHWYSANTSMTDQFFLNADGDMLIVPQSGTLDMITELGRMKVAPGEICVIPRGIKFAVNLSEPSRGYISEVYQGHFVIPERGPMGSNGLANERDFKTPVAWFEDRETPYLGIHKFGGSFFTTVHDRSPFDVVAWHGNYVPFKYDLNLYCAMNSVTYDHPDPSIFTVLTVPTNEPGVAALDFVIFPKRWQVQWNTFRLPYYHRNCMSEFMGNIYGSYEAKPSAFSPGASSLHSCMSGHGPDAEAFKKSTTASEEPFLLPDGISFMFESTYMMKVSNFSRSTEMLDLEYPMCWRDLKSHFKSS